MDKFEALRTKLESVRDNGNTYVTVIGVLTMMLMLDEQEKLSNGLTKEETDSSASVQGLSRKVNPPDFAELQSMWSTYANNCCSYAPPDRRHAYVTGVLHGFKLAKDNNAMD
jgi:hypothetical protein